MKRLLTLWRSTSDQNARGSSRSDDGSTVAAPRATFSNA
ncbi:Uncharacterised protein [Mycobacterium tuberculosis]|nr:Uncharacterised protein [Mycobacterium tuberculosis]